MDKQHLSVVMLFMVVAFLSPAVSFALTSDESIQTRLPTSRTLLQAQQDNGRLESVSLRAEMPAEIRPPTFGSPQTPHCPVDFGGLSLTRLRSECRGPEYSAEECCDAFKEFACPYADLLNDPKNNCAVSLFKQINLYFPPGLFFDKCHDSKRGAECPDSYPNSPSPSPTRVS